MRIGIVTLSVSVNNYGGMLQAYALKKFLSKFGHKVDVIDKKQCPVVDLASRGFKDYPKILFYVYKRIIDKYVHRRKIPIMHSEWYVLIQNSNVFIKDYLQPRYIGKWSDIKEQDYDAIIVGSDQVWRPPYFSNIFGDIRNAYLDFTSGWNIKRIAYAASFGVSESTEYNSLEMQICSYLLKKFDGISVREDSGIRILLENFSCNKAIKALDPTFLLDSDDYYEIISHANTSSPNGDLLCYILDSNPDKSEIIAKYAKNNNLTPFNPVGDLFNESLPLDERKQPSVGQWLRNFIDSKVVITDSFHGCVFSIIFHKPFYCIINEHRGSDRFYTLLNDLGLKERIKDKSNFNYSHEYEIDWDSVDIRLDNLKNESIEFLIKYL